MPMPQNERVSGRVEERSYSYIHHSGMGQEAQAAIGRNTHHDANNLKHFFCGVFNLSSGNWSLLDQKQWNFGG